MSIWQALVLGMIQGLAEFVPVSSTAHLYLAQAVLGIRNDQVSLSFDIVLHLGTALALIVSTRRELAAILEETIRRFQGRPPVDPASRVILVPLVVGTAPGVLAGLFLLKKFEEMRTVGFVGASMLVACVYFFLAESLADRHARSERHLAELDTRDGLWIGLAQAAAGLMAGFSRSGFTIATGRIRRFARVEAARFSFLLALPLILGAGGKAVLDLRKAAHPAIGGSILLAGFLASTAVGYLAIEGMLKFLRKHSLRPFGVYLGVLGLLLVLGTVVPGLSPFGGHRSASRPDPARSHLLVSQVLGSRTRSRVVSSRAHRHRTASARGSTRQEESCPESGCE
jgi:undecaprenyl-diphosphatase